MLWKIAGDEFANHAAEVRGHQHILQPLHALQSECGICGLQKVREIDHCLENVFGGNSVWNVSSIVEILKTRLLWDTKP
jgi:HPt (histidine-containing phosphotransfer) domain-containing protein